MFGPYKPTIAYCKSKLIPCQGTSPCINLCESPDKMRNRVEKEFEPMGNESREQLLQNYNRRLEGNKGILLLKAF